MEEQVKDKRIAVIGLGVEGAVAAQYLTQQGANVTVLEQKELKDIHDDFLDALYGKDIKIIFGKDYLSDLSSYDLLVRSPGVPLATPELVRAKEKGSIITSQTKLFIDLCPSPIIGVTGTKGKGTTATLIYEMLKKQGFDAYLGGNIGQPPFTFLDKLTEDSWVVLELSSFQLEDMEKSPHIAVMLMVTTEHLAADSVGTQNYHNSLEDYLAAKRNLVRYQTAKDFAILNRDYPATNESDIHTEAQIFHISRERDVPEQGCFVKDNALWVRRGGNEKKIIATEDILLPGKHNLENASAAIMAAMLAGVEKDAITAVLKTFQGLEHRLERVAEINGVTYYDDSFSTTPETAIAAIAAFQTPEILILGGSSKGSDFTELGNVIDKTAHIKAIIGIGQEWSQIKAKIKNKKINIVEDCQTMQEIVQKAAALADSGDVVLLSPACASFGMFANYKERGEQFKEEVRKLQK